MALASFEREPAVKITFDIESSTWRETNVMIRLEPKPFAEGALRRAHRMWVIGDDGSKELFVAKISKDPNATAERYMEDVIMQAVARRWANKFNNRGVPKKVEFLVAFLVQLTSRASHPVCAVEKFVQGEYVRYNNNWNWSDSVRNTPSAFSHFSYDASGHRLLICDLQGVGDVWTDPQIHTSDGVGFGRGNKGALGMAKFFQAHRCNAICAFLGLPNIGGMSPKACHEGTPPLNALTQSIYGTGLTSLILDDIRPLELPPPHPDIHSHGEDGDYSDPPSPNRGADSKWSDDDHFCVGDVQFIQVSTGNNCVSGPHSLKVESVGSGGFGAGIRPGDVLVAVDGVNMCGLSLVGMRLMMNTAAGGSFLCAFLRGVPPEETGLTPCDDFSLIQAKVRDHAKALLLQQRDKMNSSNKDRMFQKANSDSSLQQHEEENNHHDSSNAEDYESETLPRLVQVSLTVLGTDGGGGAGAAATSSSLPFPSSLSASSPTRSSSSRSLQRSTNNTSVAEDVASASSTHLAGSSCNSTSFSPPTPMLSSPTLVAAASAMKKVQSSFSPPASFAQFTQNSNLNQTPSKQILASGSNVVNHSNNAGGNKAMCGVGMGVAVVQGRCVITSVRQGGPADEGGVRGGDELYEVDGESMRGMSLEDIIARIKGPQGSMVTLCIGCASAGRKARRVHIIRATEPNINNNGWQQQQQQQQQQHNTPLAARPVPKSPFTPQQQLLQQQQQQQQQRTPMSTNGNFNNTTPNRPGGVARSSSASLFSSPGPQQQQYSQGGTSSTPLMRQSSAGRVAASPSPSPFVNRSPFPPGRSPAQQQQQQQRVINGNSNNNNNIVSPSPKLNGLARATNNLVAC